MESIMWCSALYLKVGRQKIITAIERQRRLEKCSGYCLAKVEFAENRVGTLAIRWDVINVVTVPVFGLLSRPDDVMTNKGADRK